MVPGAGLEPARYFYRGILSPLCLPIPPPGQTMCVLYINSLIIVWFKLTNYQEKNMKDYSFLVDPYPIYFFHQK
jgi:hypothetical protein